MSFTQQFYSGKTRNNSIPRNKQKITRQADMDMVRAPFLDLQIWLPPVPLQALRCPTVEEGNFTMTQLSRICTFVILSKVIFAPFNILHAAEV